MQCLGDPSETLDALLQLFGAPRERAETVEAKTEWALSVANERQARNRQKVLLRLEALPAGDEGLLCYVDWCNAQAEGRRPTEERVSRYINEFARPQQDRIRLLKIRPSTTTSNAHVGATELLIDPVLRLQQRLSSSSSLERSSQTITKPKSWSTTSTETASPPPSPQRKQQQSTLAADLQSIANNWMSPSTEATYPISSIYFSGPLAQDENAQEVPVLEADQNLEMALPSATLARTIRFVENTLLDSVVSPTFNTLNSSPPESFPQPRRRKAANSISQRPKKDPKTNAKDSVNRTPRSKNEKGGTHGSFRANEFEWPILKAGQGTNPIEPAPQHSLSLKVLTVTDILQEWRYGIDGGAAIQDLNREFGKRWRIKFDKSNYDRRLAIVKEYVRLVQEDQLSSDKAIRSLQTLQGTSSMNVFYKTIMESRRLRTGQDIPKRLSKAATDKTEESASEPPTADAGHADDASVLEDVSTLEDVSMLENVSALGDVSTLDITAADSPVDGGVLESNPADIAQPVVDNHKKGRGRKATKSSTADSETIITPQSEVVAENKKTTGGKTPTSVASRSTNPTKASTTMSETAVPPQSQVIGSDKKRGRKVSTPLILQPPLVIRAYQDKNQDAASGSKRKRGKQAEGAMTADPSEYTSESQSTSNITRKRAKKVDVAAQPTTTLESDPVNDQPFTAVESDPTGNQKLSRRRGARKVGNASLPPIAGDTRPSNSAESEETDVQRNTRNRAYQSKAAAAAVTIPSAEASPVTTEESSTAERRKDRRRRSTSPCDLEWTPFPVRNLLSVRDIWTEWTKGWEGEPAMESLVQTHGRLWLNAPYKHQYTYFYCRERCVKAIRDAVDKGSVSSAEEAIVLMDGIRKNLSLSYLLNHELFRNAMNSWGLRFARKRKEKEPKPDSESGPESEPESEAAAGAEAEADPEADPEAEAEADPEAEVEPEAEAEAEAEPEPQSES